MRSIFEKRQLTGEPVTKEELKGMLADGPVDFEFIKLDGNKREATGTRDTEYIPEEDHPKGVKTVTNQIPFYDLDIEDWRSVSMKTYDIALPEEEVDGDTPTVIATEKPDEGEPQHQQTQPTPQPVDRPADDGDVTNVPTTQRLSRVYVDNDMEIDDTSRVRGSIQPKDDKTDNVFIDSGDYLSFNTSLPPTPTSQTNDIFTSNVEMDIPSIKDDVIVDREHDELDNDVEDRNSDSDIFISGDDVTTEVGPPKTSAATLHVQPSTQPDTIKYDVDDDHNEPVTSDDVNNDLIVDIDGEDVDVTQNVHSMRDVDTVDSRQTSATDLYMDIIDVVVDQDVQLADVPKTVVSEQPSKNLYIDFEMASQLK